jgi:hypothetical protein
MKLMLTSFGVDQSSDRRHRMPLLRKHGDVAIHLERHGREEPHAAELFYRMPPVDMRRVIHGFFPEYWVLILCDALVIDSASYERLLHNPPPWYTRVAATFQRLHAEGFVELVDYSSILKRNKQLLSKMTEHDLRGSERWANVLGESLKEWARFLDLFDRGAVDATPSASARDARNQVMHMTHMNTTKALMMLELGSDARPAEDWVQAQLQEALRSYLTYVNSNIILSNELGTGFHDWSDFMPFYRQKFLTVGRDAPQHSRAINASRRLFAVSFPEFAPQSDDDLVRILRHRRVSELRALVQGATEGQVRFDRKFAKDVLREVIRTERRIKRYRKIVSYATLPISFIPWIGTLAQIAADEAIERLVDARMKREQRWFYMLTDISERTAQPRPLRSAAGRRLDTGN